jgi:hypothetical protein
MLCELCRALDVEWVHELDPAKSSFRQYGKGQVWASRIHVCDRCDQLYRDGEFEALVSLQVGDGRLADDVIDETIRKPFAVYRAAHQRVLAYDDVLPAGVRALREEGFVPVAELTGNQNVAQAWPSGHRQSVPETRQEWLDSLSDDRLFWLIRSPWPGISVSDAFSVLWDYVHPRAPVVGHRIDPDQERAAIAEFASLDEGYVASLISERGRGDD